MSTTQPKPEALVYLPVAPVLLFIPCQSVIGAIRWDIRVGVVYVRL